MSSATNIKILKDTKIGNPDFRHNYLDFASQLSQAVSYCVVVGKHLCRLCVALCRLCRLLESTLWLCCYCTNYQELFW